MSGQVLIALGHYVIADIRTPPPLCRETDAALTCLSPAVARRGDRFMLCEGCDVSRSSNRLTASWGACPTGEPYHIGPGEAKLTNAPLFLTTLIMNVYQLCVGRRLRGMLEHGVQTRWCRLPEPAMAARISMLFIPFGWKRCNLRVTYRSSGLQLCSRDAFSDPTGVLDLRHPNSLGLVRTCDAASRCDGCLGIQDKCRAPLHAVPWASRTRAIAEGRTCSKMLTSNFA